MIQSPTTPMPHASPRASRLAGCLLGAMLLAAPWVAVAAEHRVDEDHGRDAWAAGLRFDRAAWSAQGASHEHAPYRSFEDRAARHFSDPSGDDGDAPLPALSSALPVTFFSGGETNPTAGGAIDLAPVTAVPEPDTYVLMLAGLLVVGFVARRRRALDPQAL